MKAQPKHFSLMTLCQNLNYISVDSPNFIAIFNSV